MSEPRILVVEDEQIVALDIKNRLERLGYSVPAVAAGGKESIRKTSETHPDLVLMDIRLKGELDGIQAAEEIHSRFDIPVVYLTAYADDETLGRAKSGEPFGYLLKPFEERELHAAIQMALHKHKTHARLKETEQWLDTTLKSIADAVITTNLAGRITFINSVAADLTGCDQDEAMGKHLTDVMRVMNARAENIVDYPVAKALLTGKVVRAGTGEFLLIASDGARIPIDDSAAPIVGEKDKCIGAVVVFRDATKRKRAEDTLRGMLRELNCIYAICNIIDENGVRLDYILQRVVNVLSSSWRPADTTCARIVLGETEFKPKNFAKTNHRQSSPIVAEQEQVGLLEVYRFEGGPGQKDDPFARNEQGLINTVAMHLGRAVERKRLESKVKQLAKDLDRCAELF